MEAALNRTAARLGQSFAETESRRRELAAMMDSMQEAVVAITPEGVVHWANAVMQRVAGTQMSWPVCEGRWKNARYALDEPVPWRQGASLRSMRHRCRRAGRCWCCTT